VNGNSLPTDTQLTDAIMRGLTPLCATLTDASIHYIENRREELAQMQWKLVRDQMTGCTGKVASVGRQVSEVQQQMDIFKQETQRLVERVKAEVFRAVENEREVAHTEMKQIAERLNAMGQLLNNERNKREATMAGFEKSMQGIRDMLDSERDSHRQDVALYMSAVQDAKNAVESEKIAREAFEDKHGFDMHTLNQRIETANSDIAAMLQDQAHVFTKSADDCSSALQQQHRLVARLRSETEAHIAETNVRISEFDARCVAFETRMADAASRQSATIERVLERHEKVAAGLESIRLDQNKKTDELPHVYDKIKHLEAFVLEKDEEARDMVNKERLSRDEHVRRSQMILLQEHTKQIGDLERKLGERLERESVNREEVMREVYQDVRTRTKLSKSLESLSEDNKSITPLSPLPLANVSVADMSASMLAGSATGISSPRSSQKYSAGPPRRFSTSPTASTAGSLSGTLGLSSLGQSIATVRTTSPTRQTIPVKSASTLTRTTSPGVKPAGSYTMLTSQLPVQTLTPSVQMRQVGSFTAPTS